MRIGLTDRYADFQLSPNNRDPIDIPVLSPGRRKNNTGKPARERHFNVRLFEPMESELIAFFFDFRDPDKFSKQEK